MSRREKEKHKGSYCCSGGTAIIEQKRTVATLCNMLDGKTMKE